MPTSQSARISRRTFVAGVGTGAVIAVTSSLSLAGVLAQSRPRQFVLREDRFGRIFPSLPPFAEASPALDAALRDIGKPGGMLDARDKLLAGPVQLIVDPALSSQQVRGVFHADDPASFADTIANVRKAIAVRESRDTIRLLPQPGPADASHSAPP